MVYADLHVHTTRSDGSLAPDSVPAVARRSDVSVVAITDHDRLPPFEAPVVEHDGVTLIGGIELRVDTGDRRVDLLGYGVESTPALERELSRIQRDRIERGKTIVEHVEVQLGVDLDLDVGEGTGRPHVARAIDAHPETDLDYQGAFDELIGNGGPCYVAREITPFDRGRRLLADACGVVSLAHPLRYDDPEAALALSADLDAVERAYPYDWSEDDPSNSHDRVDLAPVDRAIAEYDLLETGGSDAHDDRLGRAGLSREAYRELRRSLR